MMGLQGGAKSDDMYSHFDTIRKRDRQMDGRTKPVAKTHRLTSVRLTRVTTGSSCKRSLWIHHQHPN